MKVTEIRVFPKEGQDKKLKAYTTVTFDNCFVVRNIKVIQGTSSLFIAMPSRKMRYACLKCRFKHEAGAKFCGQCGTALSPRPALDVHEDAKNEHRDTAHPVTQEFREYLQSEVLKAYQEEAEKIASGLIKPTFYDED